MTKPLTLDALIERLTDLRDNDMAVTGKSPVIVEGYNEAGDFVQGLIESVSTKARCEDDDQEQGVYINLIDVVVDAGAVTGVYDHQASETECTLPRASEAKGGGT